MSDAAAARAPFAPWLGAILLVALGLRVYEIGVPDVWVDEANLILLSGQPLDVLFERLTRDSSPPLYYLLVGAWSALVGDAPIALRMMSVVIGVTLVAATAWVGRDLVSPQAGLWAALFVAVSPGQAFYSQQVRMYGLLALLALLSFTGLLRYLRDGRRRDFAGWIAASVLALYTHNFAFHLFPAQLVVICLSGQLRARLGHWIAAAAIVGALYAPWLPSLLAQLENRDHYAWFLPFWEHWGVTGTLGNLLRSYSPSGEFQAYAAIGFFGRWWSLPTWGACALAAYGGWSCLTHSRGATVVVPSWPVVWLTTPIATGLLLSFALTPHLVPGRVDQMMLPAFALLVGVGLARLPRVPRLALAVAIVALGVDAKYEMFHRYAGDVLDGSDRDIARVVAETWRPGDVIVCTSLSRASLEYYLGRERVDAPILSYPRSSAEHLGAQNDNGLLEDKVHLLREANAVTTRARSVAGPEGRVIVVWVHTLVNYPLRAEAMEGLGLRDGEPLGRFRQFGTGHQVEVRVYRAAAPP